MKPKNEPDSNGAYQIAEEMIVFNNTMNSNTGQFRTLLDHAEQFRSANMTPVFLYDPKSALLFVGAEETYGKLLN